MHSFKRFYKRDINTVYHILLRNGNFPLGGGLLEKRGELFSGRIAVLQKKKKLKSVTKKVYKQKYLSVIT